MLSRGVRFERARGMKQAWDQQNPLGHTILRAAHAIASRKRLQDSIKMNGFWYNAGAATAAAEGFSIMHTNLITPREEDRQGVVHTTALGDTPRIHL